MTVEELYQWCIEHGCADYEIEIKFRDFGGYYSGTDGSLLLETDNDNKEITL